MLLDGRVACVLGSRRQLGCTNAKFFDSGRVKDALFTGPSAVHTRCQECGDARCSSRWGGVVTVALALIWDFEVMVLLDQLAATTRLRLDGGNLLSVAAR